MSEPFTLAWGLGTMNFQALVDGLTGTINSEEFRICPPHTLLASHPEIYLARVPDGSLRCMVAVRFVPAPQPLPFVSLHPRNDPNRLYPWREVDFGALIPAGAEIVSNTSL